MIALSMIWIIFSVLVLVDVNRAGVGAPIVMLINGFVYAVLALLFARMKLMLKVGVAAFLLVNLVFGVSGRMAAIDYIAFALNVIAASSCIAIIIRIGRARRARY